MTGTTTLNRAMEPRAAAADTAVQHAGRQLLDGLSRVLRNATAGRAGWMLLALHLSRIAPPGPRAHHRRVAAAVLEDAATRSDGQLFALSNGDLALLFRPGDGGADVAGLIARLFQAYAPGPDALRSLWALPEAAADALEYIRARVTEGDRAPPPAEPQSSAGVIAAMDAMVQSASLGDLMHRQTAILLRPGHAQRIAPLFREVAISTAVLEARIAAVGQANADPFLFSHLAARLDHRMLATLAQDVPASGPLSGALDQAALHVNLTLTGILSAGFGSFAGACQGALDRGLRIGVEVPFVEAFADPKGFVLARERLRLARLQLVLDGVTHQVLALSSPGALEPELVKLNWSASMPGGGAALRAAIGRLGAERIVLHRAESEAALSWGLEHGIQRFQGRYVDSLLAAGRLAGCRHAAGCTIRQCSERASATGPAGRAGCFNPGLLDTAAPRRAAEPAG